MEGGRRGEITHLRGADGAELEAVSAVWEWRGAVAVLGGDGEGGDLGHAEVDRRRLGRVLLEDLSALELLEVRRERVAEIGRDDCRGRLARAEAEVVARGGDRHAHQVAVHVDRLDNRRHDHTKDLGASGLGDLHTIIIRSTRGARSEVAGFGRW